MDYDYLVIGKGLFGSAAARHLSKLSNSVALVGPDEPEDWPKHDGVFASHYDEARVVSASAPDEIMATLDHRSIAAYAEIEAQSGIRFYTPSGRLSAVPQSDAAQSYPYLSHEAANCRRLFSDELGFQFPANYDVVFESAPSGYLNPRAMVRAQIVAGETQGLTVIDGLAIHVTVSDDGVVVSLADGRVISAEKILIATGAFANRFELLPQKLAVKVEMISTVMGEVSAETAQQLSELPPLNFWAQNSPLTHLTILPPLQYPDSRFYIKASVFSDADTPLLTQDALSNWFRSERTFPYLTELETLFKRLLPETPILSWKTKPCVATYTPTWKPIIDCLQDGRVYIATGGNGGSAHPSDAIGKLAADFMLNNKWSSDLAHASFQAQYADEWQEWMANPVTVWASPR